MGFTVQFTSVPIELLRVVTIRTPDSFATPLAGLVIGKFTELLFVQRISLLLLRLPFTELS